MDISTTDMMVMSTRTIFYNLITLALPILLYAYLCFSLQTIAKRTNTEKGWLAWIPIANIVLMCMIAKKPVWWLVLALIPIVNIIIFILIWVEIAKSVNKPAWTVVLFVVPIVNLILPGYYAFSK